MYICRMHVDRLEWLQLNVCRLRGALRVVSSLEVCALHVEVLGTRHWPALATAHNASEKREWADRHRRLHIAFWDGGARLRGRVNCGGCLKCGRGGRRGRCWSTANTRGGGGCGCTGGRIKREILTKNLQILFGSIRLCCFLRNCKFIFTRDGRSSSFFAGNERMTGEHNFVCGTTEKVLKD